MRVLVTGGAGYLGSVLCAQLLGAGHQVRVADRLLFGGASLLAHAGEPGFEFRRADVRDPDAMAAALDGMESVVHLAAIVGDPACALSPQEAREVNLEASCKLVGTADAAGIDRFVFASTCSNYGRIADTSILATEDHELRPLSLYAETKVGVETELLNGMHPRLATTVLRFATLYGLSPRMRLDLTVNEFVMEMLVNRSLVVYGDQFWRPYVHVRDAARAVTMVLAAPRETIAGAVFNVGDTAENHTKAQLVELIGRRVGRAAVKRVERAEDPRDYRVSFDRIRERLGYRISRTVADGIDEIATALESGLLADLGDRTKYNSPPASLQ